MQLTDESPMPFGKYKGTKLANVPASYLIWLYYNGLNPGSLKDYITDNLDVLKDEINKQAKAK
jgi:uncharacterized protein (DUF3820 family)